MLSKRIAEALYETNCLKSGNFLKDNVALKDAEELVSYTMAELNEMLPDDKRKFFLELETHINNRESIYGKESYIYGFEQGARFILELLISK